MKIRKTLPEDIPELAEIWYQGWTESHADHVPQALVRLRTKENFAERLHGMLPDIRSLGPLAAPLGFCEVRDNQIGQIYVGTPARGTGVAAGLLQDGEDRIRAAGYGLAFLNAIPKNTRAIAFYQKLGWKNGEIMIVNVETSLGAFPLKCLSLTKEL